MVIKKVFDNLRNSLRDLVGNEEENNKASPNTLKRIEDSVMVKEALDTLSEDLNMSFEDLMTEERGQYGSKLHLISLAELQSVFHDKWENIEDKILNIITNVLDLNSSTYGYKYCFRPDSDFLMIFPNMDENNIKHNLSEIIVMIGKKILGERFYGESIPLFSIGSIDGNELFNHDGSMVNNEKLSSLLQSSKVLLETKQLEHLERDLLLLEKEDSAKDSASAVLEFYSELVPEKGSMEKKIATWKEFSGRNREHILTEIEENILYGNNRLVVDPKESTDKDIVLKEIEKTEKLDVVFEEVSPNLKKEEEILKDIHSNDNLSLLHILKTKNKDDDNFKWILDNLEKLGKKLEHGLVSYLEVSKSFSYGWHALRRPFLSRHSFLEVDGNCEYKGVSKNSIWCLVKEQNTIYSNISENGILVRCSAVYLSTTESISAYYISLLRRKKGDFFSGIASYPNHNNRSAIYAQDRKVVQAGLAFSTSLQKLSSDLKVIFPLHFSSILDKNSKVLEQLKKNSKNYKKHLIIEVVATDLYENIQIPYRRIIKTLSGLCSEVIFRFHTLDIDYAYLRKKGVRNIGFDIYGYGTLSGEKRLLQLLRFIQSNKEEGMWSYIWDVDYKEELICAVKSGYTLISSSILPVNYKDIGQAIPLDVNSIY